jgi:hypothetical protein
MNVIIYLIPVFSAILGWFLNLLLCRHLQRSYFPKLTAKLSKQAGSGITSIFRDRESLKNLVESSGLAERSLPYLEEQVDHFLTTKLPEEIPMLSMFITSKTTDQVKAVFLNELKTLIPGFLSKLLSAETGEKTDFDNFLGRKIEEMTSKQFLSPVFSAALKKLKIWGFATGLCIGLLNLLLVLWF